MSISKQIVIFCERGNLVARRVNAKSRVFEAAGLPNRIWVRKEALRPPQGGPHKLEC
jgi:hypothetical protein